LYNGEPLLDLISQVDFGKGPKDQGGLHW
jgi:hypothetical protein